MNKALLIHQAALGDFLVVCRLIEFCDEAFGRHEWSYLGRSSHGRLAKALGLVADHKNFDAPGWHLLFTPDGDIPVSTRGFLAQFDLVLNVVTGPETVFARRLNELCSGRVFHIEPKLPEDFPGHIFEFLSRQIKNGTPTVLPKTAFAIDPAIRSQVEKEISSRRLVILHPGASTAAKRLPLTHFLREIEQANRAGDEPGVLLGEVEMEQFPAADIERLKSAARVFSGWPLEKVAALLRLSKKYIGNDNGVSHLAGAVGADATVFFIWANPTHWHPLGPRVNVICPKTTKRFYDNLT